MFRQHLCGRLIVRDIEDPLDRTRNDLKAAAAHFKESLSIYPAGQVASAYCLAGLAGAAAVCGAIDDLGAISLIREVD